MTDLAKLNNEGGVATLTLNRPDARNALSLPLLTALAGALDRAAALEDAACLVVTGAGKAFCAGMDLKAVLDEPGAPQKLLTAIADVARKIRAVPVPVVAKVNAAAIGGGCGLLCACDMAVTHADAKLGFPEVDLGVCPAVVAPLLLRRVGAGRARRILLEAGLLTGAQAHELGMVTTLVETRGELDDAVQAITTRLAGASLPALRATKRCLNELDDENLDAELTRGAALSAEVIGGEEAQTRLRQRLGG